MIPAHREETALLPGFKSAFALTADHIEMVPSSGSAGGVLGDRPRPRVASQTNQPW